ncbi:MAG: GNAT family N-acetyltransferase [Candidatus Kapaibacterium sp.]
MSYYRQLMGEKCYLSPIDEKDAELYCTWLNDPYINCFLEASFSVTPDDERELIRKMKKEGNIVFGIVDKSTDKLIGGTGFHLIEPINRTAMYGIYIGDREFHGKGYGFDATMLILDYGFNMLNFKSIYLWAFAYNTKAIDMYRKLGFKEMGRRRQARYLNGEYHDIIYMDILEDEFPGYLVSKSLKSITGK